MPIDADPATLAFVVLLNDDNAAQTIARLIGDRARFGDGHRVVIPPVRGIEFFADPAQQSELDRWWRDNVIENALPIYVIDDERGLEGWLDGMDGLFFVRKDGVEDIPDHSPPSVHHVYARTPGELVAAVLQKLSERVGLSVDAHQHVEQSVASLGSNGHLLIPSGERVHATSAATADPFELLASMTSERVAKREATPLGDAAGDLKDRKRRRLSLLRSIGSAPTRDDGNADDELGRTFAAHGSTIVAIGSRKGGVGKTSHAAGVAIVSGAALDSVGLRAAIVDANIANPDAWGVLNLPPGAATVRDTVAALSANLDPPKPVYATTPALACYPEARESTEYSRVEVQLLAGHLRRKYALSVVDLSNRLPDAAGGAEAAAVAYWLEVADVLVLPTASSKQDFHGVLDFLELDGLPPCVVAYIVPKSRRTRDHPLAQRYMATIRQRVSRVVDVPDVADDVRFAGMEGVPIDTVSRQLHLAYRELTSAIAAALGQHA